MWYKTGTVALVNGVATVAGTGTDWINGAGTGEGFVAPDGKIYEIASIQSATQLTLGTDYYGPTASGQAYQIIPSQSYMRDLANQVATLVNNYADVANITGAGKFSNGTTSAPAIRFIDDENTGLNHATADTLELVTGATARLTASGSGVLIPTADINGGTIDGTAIGGTTPAAGSFTTLSATNGASPDTAPSLVVQGAASNQGGVQFGSSSVGYRIVGGLAYAGVDIVAGGVTAGHFSSSGLGVTGTLSVSSGLVAAPGYFNASGSGSSGAVVNTTENQLWAAGSKIATVSSSGLAVTGALTATGNLGIGVTPSAWYTGYKAIEIGAYGSISDYLNIGGVQIAANATHTSNDVWNYKNSYFASMYQQGDGKHSWYTAPSGTAGNPIAFTPAMTLGADGNLGLGVTPSAWASGHRAAEFGAAANSVAALSGGDFNLANNAFLGGSGWVYKVSAGATRFQQDFGVSRWMIDSGTKTAGAACNFTTAMTLDANGNLLVGATSTDPSVGMVYVSSISSSSPRLQLGHALGTAGGGSYLDIFYNSTAIGSITQSGTTAVLYNTSSDARLKENIVDAPAASDLIDAIQVRSFDWKSDGSHQRYGMVAQELYEVAPEAVSKPADPDEMMAVDYSKLVPMLVKEIQSLRARVASLEAPNVLFR